MGRLAPISIIADSQPQGLGRVVFSVLSQHAPDGAVAAKADHRPRSMK